MKKFILLLTLSISLLAKTQTIVLGAGCFWGVEKYFETLNGVIKVSSGYAGGEYKNPTYRDVLKHKDNRDILNHTEVVEVVYNDRKLSTEQLIKAFWELHNPTQGNQQGNNRNRSKKVKELFFEPLFALGSDNPPA